jgi:transcriptional regulator with XRE-family HTH domain
MASGTLITQRRETLGLTQGQLAERAATSRERINSYERGRVHPTADTLERVLNALGCELAAMSALTYEERRSLAVSEAVAQRLVAEPEPVIAAARRNIGRMRKAATHEHPWLDIWEGLLDLGPVYVAMMLTSKDQFARDLRQSSPFAGVLTDEERLAAVRDIKR